MEATLITALLSFVALPLAIAGNSPVTKFFGLVLIVFAIPVARRCARYLDTVASTGTTLRPPRRQSMRRRGWITAGKKRKQGHFPIKTGNH